MLSEKASDGLSHANLWDHILNSVTCCGFLDSHGNGLLSYQALILASFNAADLAHLVISRFYHYPYFFLTSPKLATTLVWFFPCMLFAVLQ